MKVLVQQVNVFGGIMQNSFSVESLDDEDFLIEVTLPSAKKYAKKYGYDYHIETNIPEKIEQISLNNTSSFHKLMRYAYIKYLMLEKYTEYDYILLLDADTLVTNQTPNLPLKTGLSASQVEWDRTHEFNYTNYDNIKFENRFVLVNAGFLLFDKETAREMYEFIKKRINYLIEKKISTFHDEHEILLFMNTHQEIVYNDLGDKWNHWKSLFENPIYIPDKYIYHFTKAKKLKRYKDAVNARFIDKEGNYIPK